MQPRRHEEHEEHEEHEGSLYTNLRILPSSAVTSHATTKTRRARRIFVHGPPCPSSVVDLTCNHEEHEDVLYTDLRVLPSSVAASNATTKARRHAGTGLVQVHVHIEPPRREEDPEQAVRAG